MVVNNLDYNSKTFDCSICYKTQTNDEYIMLSCGHYFCKPCFIDHVNTCLNFNVNPTCSFCRKTINRYDLYDIFNELLEIELVKKLDLLKENSFANEEYEETNWWRTLYDKIVNAYYYLNNKLLKKESNTYSFNLCREQYIPSGTCNMSRINNVQLCFRNKKTKGLCPETYQPYGTINFS